MNLYLVYAESANYCGYGQHFVVRAYSKEEAEQAADDSIQEYFYEQDVDHLQEEYGEDFEDISFFGHPVRTEEFTPEHDSWKFYIDPSQAEFYIKVNF